MQYIISIYVFYLVKGDASSYIPRCRRWRDTVYAGVPDTVCIDEPQFTFTNFTPTSGGTWSGNGIVDANAGIFDPVTAGIANHVVSYTFGTGTCE